MKLVLIPESSYHLDRLKAPGFERSQIGPDYKYGRNLRSFNLGALTRPDDRNFRELALVLQEVAPSHEKWPVFLDHVVAYLVETWPAVCGDNTTLDAFKAQYEKELVARIKEGGRGLFLVTDGTKDVGIINAYITKNKEEAFLHIAEFCVFPEERRHGYGRKMVQLIDEWGRSQGATKMFVEVDKDLLVANSFWRSLPGLQVDPSDVRNIYYKKIY